jgi:phosphatidylglycerol---prolipoprotein diacylglyceryl transferase
MIAAARGATGMLIHTVFDLLAWICAALMARWISRAGYLDGVAVKRSLRSDPWYFTALGIGAMAGAIFFGTFNLGLAGFWTFGHSIAGAIAGGIVSVEIYKLVRGIRGSTGLPFVGPLATGIAVGRFGCFFAGLPDYTYGTPTALPWGVDFGDGIARHPVQLYESAAMFAFLAVYLRALQARSELFLRDGFYLFVGWYALQRFAWEFLKPYPTVLGPFNVFHFVCIALFGYSLFMMRWNHELRPAV